PVPAPLVRPVLEGRQPPVRILVTGYGKFGPYTEDGQNPSWQLAQQLAAKKFPGAEVKAVLLPVEWSRVEAFSKDVLATYEPDVIINLGAGRNTIEAWAENETSGEDATGRSRFGEPALPGGPEWLQSTLPLSAIEAALDRAEDARNGGRLHLRAGEGTPQQRLEQARLEQDRDWANKYLCNFLNYRMLAATRGTGVLSGFFHVDETTAPQELEVVVEQSLIAALQARRTTRPNS
ncbi:MAG: hypothetical protein ACK4N5_13815, partial [Myxococcales bacterium]